MANGKNDSNIESTLDRLEEIAGLRADASKIHTVIEQSNRDFPGLFSKGQPVSLNYYSAMGTYAKDSGRREFQKNMQLILDDPESFSHDQIRFLACLAVIAVREYEYLGDFSKKLDESPVAQSDALQKRILAEYNRINDEFINGGDVLEWSRASSEIALGIQAQAAIRSFTKILEVTQQDKDLFPPTREEAESRAETVVEFLEKFSDHLHTEEAREAVKPLLESIRSRFNILSVPTDAHVTNETNRPNDLGR